MLLAFPEFPKSPPPSSSSALIDFFFFFGCDASPPDDITNPVSHTHSRTAARSQELVVSVERELAATSLRSHHQLGGDIFTCALPGQIPRDFLGGRRLFLSF